jgi:hypothetical protein
LFQLATWYKAEIPSVVFLPLRDTTYDHHKSEPPLDTIVKQRVFRIDPPRFHEVLHRRVQLALNDIAKDRSRKLTYALPNGMRVTYPVEQLEYYLRSILRSIFEHDRYVRKTAIGLAGRDIRKAMEIFLEFCSSGHIGENHILAMKNRGGNYIIPLDVVRRVLLRRNRRFYSDESSFIKNLLAIDTSDPHPIYGLRLAVLRWLRTRAGQKGEAGFKGYHAASLLMNDLSHFGVGRDSIGTVLDYLLREQLIVAEHLRGRLESESDLLSITPAGHVHLDFMTEVDYFAAIGESLPSGTKNSPKQLRRKSVTTRDISTSELLSVWPQRWSATWRMQWPR